MTVARLINLFASFTKAVEVEEVRQQIVEWGYYDRIVISPFDKPEERLLGMLLDYVSILPYGREVECCVVRYNQNLSVPHQRLVCVKELVHSLDQIQLKVSSKQQLNNLLEEILHEEDDKPFISLALVSQFEDIAIYQALAILCSEEAREDLYQKYHSEPRQTSLEEIAARFVIPPEYAGCLMLPTWKQFRERLLLINHSAAPTKQTEKNA